MKGLQGKRVVIAGGATGIGAGTAERLAEEGVSVVIGDINVDGAKTLAKRITEAGGTALGVKFDFTDESSIQALVDTAISEFDGIDGLFNVGADVSRATTSRDLNVLEMDPAIWRRHFEVTSIGYALTCRAVIPHMLAQGGGAIVNISSDNVWLGQARIPAYSASKAAVNALTRHIASAWGKQGVRCNTVAPGLVLTELVDDQMTEEAKASRLEGTRSTRLGRPSDLAAVVAFLLSDDGEWINGQAWSIDGGLTMRD